RRSLRGRQISRLVSCVRPLFFGHDLCPDRLSLPVQPIPGGWSWDRTAARWRCTRPHHAPASWTRWRHTAYDRLRPVSCTGASSSVRFSVHRRPCCAPIRCCAPIQGLDIIISYSLKIRKLFSSRSLIPQVNLIASVGHENDVSNRSAYSGQASEVVLDLEWKCSRYRRIREPVRASCKLLVSLPVAIQFDVAADRHRPRRAGVGC